MKIEMQAKAKPEVNLDYPQQESKSIDEDSVVHQEQITTIGAIESNEGTQINTIPTPEEAINGFDTFAPTKLSGETAEIGYIRKVIGIFSSQITLTILIIFYFLSSKEDKAIASALVPVSLGALIVSVSMIACSDRMARRVPINYILLLIATISESVLLSVLLQKYPIDVIVFSGVATIGKNSLL